MSNPKILEHITTVAEKSPYIKVCLYGKAGVGKTVLAAHAPSPLLIDVERGSKSLENHPELDHVMQLPVISWKDIGDIYEELRAGKLPEVKTVIIDTFSELQKKFLDGQVKNAIARDGNREEFLPLIKDYNITNNAMRSVLLDFITLPMNLIIISHALEDKDESDGRVYWRPSVPARISETIEGLFDVIGYMTKDTDKDGTVTRRLRVHPSRRVSAKTRIGGLPEVLENPSFDDLLKANTSIISNGSKGAVV